MINEWTRDDLPHQHEVWDDFVAGKHSDVFHAVDADDLGEVLDEIIDHLNAHHPKPQQHDCGETIDALNRNRDALIENRDKSISLLQRLLTTAEDRWRHAHSIVESERDEARERLRETETKLAEVMSDYQDIEDEWGENMIDPESCNEYDKYYGFVGGLERKLVRNNPWLDEPWTYEDKDGIRRSVSDRNVSHLSTKPRFLVEPEPDVEAENQKLHSEWMVEHIRANAAEDRVRQLEDYIRGEK